jgi:hypothetical protein
MGLSWTDARDGKTWDVEIEFGVATSSGQPPTHTMPARIIFRLGEEEYWIETHVSPSQLDDLLDVQLPELLDVARRSPA